MNKKVALLLMAATAWCGTVSADIGNLIPRPAQMTLGTGELVLPSGFNVSTTGLSEEMKAEAEDFVAAVNHATSLGATASEGEGLITLGVDPSLAAEGYTLSVSADGVSLKAATPAGLFYGLQTVKKILPVNVMAGVKGQEGATYSLPLVEIADQPRFEYRGFMLDVSRHFFDVAQVKKMIDVMAMYKLNRFHWHLTDDQGWRLPVAKYPKLTQEGATNRNILRSDFDAKKQWRDGLDVQYGPYSYTIEELKEVVAYAKERHIEVIPEIDMPGHMVAAIHAYPEFSTDPESTIAKNAGIALDSEPKANIVESHFTHNIWNIGGVSKDVLDISNPKVIEFVKDVVDVLADVFPYEYIHIGGDECPTYAWGLSESCQKLKTDLGYAANASDAVLQTWFTKQIADYAREKHGRKIMGWNELITAGGADMNIMKELDPTIFCWIGGEAKAQNNGLKHVYTPFNGGYYINRSYAGIDGIGAVGDGALATTLNVNPPTNSLCIGVQGTFWTEQVDRPTDLEYLALPRLLGIAEQGWSLAEGKDNDEIMERICNDAALLTAAGYNYGAHQLVRPSEYLKPDPMKWYRLQSTSTTAPRNGRVWELVQTGSPLISSNSATVNKLWTNTIDANNNAQMFRFVEDPDNKGHYAIVCRAVPAGSLSATPSATDVSGRWEYQASTVTYGFELVKQYYATEENGAFHYAIRPVGANYFLNFSMAGQKFAVNAYNNPNDGNGGLVTFIESGDVDPSEIPAPPVVETVPAEGRYYRLLTRFNGDVSQPRHGSCIELLTSDAGKGNNAQANRLWSNAPATEDAANFDYQWFTFEADPQGSGNYAMVCKAKPEGSVNSVPAVANNSNTARWDYDDSAKHYGFYLVATVNGQSTQGRDDAGFYSALTSKDAAEGWYMNTSAAGQGFSVHLYSNPLDQNAGLYTFEPLPVAEPEPPVDPIEPEEPDAGIDGVSADSADAPTYDLLGRRTSATNHGLYIRGNKVIRK